MSAARFAADGSVMLLVEPPGARVSEVQRCEAPYDECRLVAFFPPGGARSLLLSPRHAPRCVGVAERAPSMLALRRLAMHTP